MGLFLQYAKEYKVVMEYCTKQSIKYLCDTTFNEILVTLAERENGIYDSSIRYGEDAEGYPSISIDYIDIMKPEFAKIIQYIRSLKHWYDDEAFDGRINYYMKSYTPKEIADILQEILDNTDPASRMVHIKWGEYSFSSI